MTTYGTYSDDHLLNSVPKSPKNKNWSENFPDHNY